MLSFVFAGIACAFAGLCYAEFAAMLPVSGSAYSYSYATLGEGVAWFIGWCLVLEYLFAASTVAVGWSGYLNAFLSNFDLALPAALASAPYTYDAETAKFVATDRSEEHTSELQSLMRISYAVSCVKKKMSCTESES